VTLRAFLADLLALLHLEAKEIERLTAHVEQQTDAMLDPSRMPLVISEFSALEAQLGRAANP
jgi:hypothetical protein